MAFGRSLVGLEITSGADIHYGRIDYASSFAQGDGLSFIVNGWAYNDVSGQGIIAGQNKPARSSGGGGAVPGFGGLGDLAIGAAGLRSPRQRTVA